MVLRIEDLAEHLDKKCLYRLEKCRYCKTQVSVNIMKVRFFMFSVYGFQSLGKKDFEQGVVKVVRSTKSTQLCLIRMLLCALLWCSYKFLHAYITKKYTSSIFFYS